MVYGDFGEYIYLYWYNIYVGTLCVPIHHLSTHAKERGLTKRLEIEPTFCTAKTNKNKKRKSTIKLKPQT